MNFIKLTLDNTETGNDAKGPVLVNIATIMAAHQYYVNLDRAPLTRLMLPNHGLQVKESLESLQKWIAKSDSDLKFLKLTLDGSGTDVVSAGPALVNIAYIQSINNFEYNPDKAILTKIRLANTSWVHVRESLESIQEWIVKADVSYHPIVNETEYTDFKEAP